MHRLSATFAGLQDIDGPLERQAYLIGRIFSTLQADPHYWGLFYGMRAQPAVHAILGDALRVWTARLWKLFRDNFSRAGRREPDLEAFMLYCLVEGAIQQYMLSPETFPLDRVVHKMIAQSWSNGQT